MILVVGATGLLGGAITRRLLEDGNDVRILVRRDSPSATLAEQGRATSAGTLTTAGARQVSGDLKDRTSLDRACRGARTVITTANAAGRAPEDTYEDVDLNGTLALIDAAEAAGVEHFVYVSAAGSAPDHPHPLFAAKGQCEARLKASNMRYTILKPGVFMEIWIVAIVGVPLRAGMPVTLMGDGGRQQAFVSLADVAAYGVTAVEHPAAQNAEIYIGGPQPYSWNDAVDAVGRALGHELPVNYIGFGEDLPLLPAMGPTLAALEQSDDHIPMAATAERFGIEPTSLDVFAGRFFGARAS